MKTYIRSLDNRIYPTDRVYILRSQVRETEARICLGVIGIEIKMLGSDKQCFSRLKKITHGRLRELE